MKKRTKLFQNILGVGLAVSVLTLLPVSVFAEDKVNLAADAAFSASTTWGDEAWVAPDKLKDGDLTTRWASADEDREVYIEIDFGKEVTVGEVYQVQGVDINGPVITSYTISCWNGSDWDEIVTDGSFAETAEQETNGKYADDSFAAVTTSRLRIDYQAEWGITLYEIEVYGGQAAAEDGSNDDPDNSQKPEGPISPDSTGKEETPKTGDVSVLVSLLAMSAAALGGRKLKRR